MESFSVKSIEKLEYYVYVLIDPRNQTVFYVGKGTGNRIFAHTGDTTFIETKKNKRIAEIENLGLNVIRRIINFNLTEQEAFASEASLITLIGIENLENVVRGHHSYESYTVEEFEIIHSAEKVVIDDPVLIIKINRRYEKDISEEKLYDATRYAWNIADWRIQKIKYVFSVYRGLVRAVYVPEQWYKTNSDTIDPITKNPAGKDLNRKYFTGKKAPDDIQQKYLHKDVSDYFSRGEQTAIRYINVNW